MYKKQENRKVAKDEPIELVRKGAKDDNRTMLAQNNDIVVAKFSRILTWALIVLSALCGIAYLTLSTLLYLKGAPLKPLYFVLLGVLFTLTSLFSSVMVIRKEKFFAFFTFFFTGGFGIVFSLALLLLVSHAAMETSSRIAVRVLFGINILAILASFFIPALRLHGRNGPGFLFFISYVVEMSIWIACTAIYVSAMSYSNDWIFLLIFGLTLLRSSQYEYLGPSEAISH